MRSRNFGPYFAGNALSSSGTWFQNLAGSILVYRLTSTSRSSTGCSSSRRGRASRATVSTARRLV